MKCETNVAYWSWTLLYGPERFTWTIKLMKERKLKNWIEITGHIVHRITYFIQQNKLKIKTKSEVKFCLQNVELLLKPLNLNHLVPSKTMLDKFVAVRILHVSYYNYCFLILLTIFEDTRQIYSLGRLERSRKQNSAHSLCALLENRPFTSVLRAFLHRLKMIGPTTSVERPS